MKRFEWNEIGCLVDVFENCENYDGPDEILKVINDLADENIDLKMTIKAQTHTINFAFQLISNVLNEKLDNLDTMYAMKQLMKETVECLEALGDRLKEFDEGSDETG